MKRRKWISMKDLKVNTLMMAMVTNKISWIKMSVLRWKTEQEIKKRKRNAKRMNWKLNVACLLRVVTGM